MPDYNYCPECGKILSHPASCKCGWVEEEEEEEEYKDLDEDSICPTCSGSGEGMSEYNRCSTCGGSGDDLHPWGKKRKKDYDEE